MQCCGAVNSDATSMPHSEAGGFIAGVAALANPWWRLGIAQVVQCPSR